MVDWREYHSHFDMSYLSVINNLSQKVQDHLLFLYIHLFYLFLLSADEWQQEATPSRQSDSALDHTEDPIIMHCTPQETRKGRMRFSAEQVQALERRFQKQHYLLPAERKLLAARLGMTERQVKTWFQNKRAQCKRSKPFLKSAFFPVMPFPTSALPYNSFVTGLPQFAGAGECLSLAQLQQPAVLQQGPRPVMFNTGSCPGSPLLPPHCRQLQQLNMLHKWSRTTTSIHQTIWKVLYHNSHSECFIFFYKSIDCHSSIVVLLR